MTRPILPQAGDFGWSGKLNDAINQVSDVADAALEASRFGALPGTLPVDSFPGTDDERLAAAIAVAASATYKPMITFGNRRYHFKKPIMGYSGLRLGGGSVGAGPLVGAGVPTGTAINIEVGAGIPWITLPGTTSPIEGLHLSNISFQSIGGSSFIEAVDGKPFRFGTVENVSFSSFKHIFGTDTTRQALIGFAFLGRLMIDDGTDVQMNVDLQASPLSSLWLGAMDSTLPAATPVIRLSSAAASQVDLVGSLGFENDTGRTLIAVDTGAVLNIAAAYATNPAGPTMTIDQVGGTATITTSAKLSVA